MHEGARNPSWAACLGLQKALINFLALALQFYFAEFTLLQATIRLHDCRGR
jgi:hypothetical protein